MKFWNTEKDYRDYIGSMTQLAGLRHFELCDGKARGVEAVEVRTGSGLEFTVLPGRGMDIAWTSYRGVPLNYMSKTGIVAPAYYESAGMNWLRSFFAGTLTTCGLLNVGGPEKADHAVIGQREYGLHGRISNCAAEQVSLFEDYEGGEYIMRVSGMTREAVLHGESLTLRREITTSFGKKSFHIKDTVTNRASLPQTVMLLYHINAGYPLLDETSRFVSRSEKIIPMSEEAASEAGSCGVCVPPLKGIAERCYSHELHKGNGGLSRVALVNDSLELGMALTFSRAQLPYFNQWKMSGVNEYVMGMEPGNCLPVGAAKAAAAGMNDLLAPGESKVYEIMFSVLDGKDEITAFESSL